MERKTRINRIVAIAAACVLVLGIVLWIAISAMGDHSTGTPVYIGKSASLAVGNDSYASYLEEHGYAGTKSTASSTVDIYAYTTGGDLRAAALSEGVSTEGEGTISWSFAVPTAGFYNVRLSYMPVVGGKTDIIRRVTVFIFCQNNVLETMATSGIKE